MFIPLKCEMRRGMNNQQLLMIISFHACVLAQVSLHMMARIKQLYLIIQLGCQVWTHANSIMNHNQVKHCYHYDHYLFFHDHDDNYEPLDCVDYCQDHYEPEDHYDHYDLEVFGVFSEDDPGEFLLWGHSNFNSAIKYLLFYIL